MLFQALKGHHTKFWQMRKKGLQIFWKNWKMFTITGYISPKNQDRDSQKFESSGLIMILG